MASKADITIDVDGPRNTHLDINIILDDTKGVSQVILDPAKQYIDPLMRERRQKYRIDHISYVLQRELSVDLWWDDDPPKLIRHLEGRGMTDRHMLCTAEKKETGVVLLTAKGWKSGEPLKGSITIEAVKQ